MDKDKEPRAAPTDDDSDSPAQDLDGADEETALARRMFLRAGLVAVPLALAAFTVGRPARAQASCKPHWCRPGVPCNPDLCGPQICNPAD